MRLSSPSGESRFSNSSPRRIDRQKKKNMALSRRVVSGGGDGGGSSVGDRISNGSSTIHDPNGNKDRLLSKKKGRPGVRKTQKKSKRSKGSLGTSRMTMSIVLGLVITGTVVMSYVYIGGNTTASHQRGVMEINENGSIESVHKLLRRKFSNEAGGDNRFINEEGGGSMNEVGEALDLPYGHHDHHKATQGGQHIHYDLEQLQEKFEQETSLLPQFPQQYLGTKPSTTFDIETDYTPLGGDRFSEYADGKQPYHVDHDLILKSNELARSRRSYVKDAMKHAWSGYEKYAFGMDEVLPLTKEGDNNWGGMAITMVDALDTLWLMGMKEEFYKGRDWVRDKLNHDKVGTVSVFETTIRSLGGLLSAYDWSGDQAFLDKAYDLGKRLIKSFDHTSTGIPYGQVDLRSGHASNIGWTGNNAILSEFGTLQVEYRYLEKAMHGAQSTDDFARKTEHVFEILDEISPANGLFPYYLVNNPSSGRTSSIKPRPRHLEKNNDEKNKKDGSDNKDELLPTFANNHLTFGAMADSLYEYMLKVWIQGGQTEPMYRDMYDKAIQGMHDELLQTSTPSGLVYIADKQGSSVQHKMDHLVCFMGGLLALGAYTDPQGLESDRAQRDLKAGRALTYTCYQMYARMSTGISPEYVEFLPKDAGTDFRIGSGAPHYLLRPEAVESFFILSFLTNDPVYREWGWEVFQSIEKYCKTDIGYGSLGNVDAPIDGIKQKPRNKQESFFFAETLKYLYLLQDPDTEVDILNKHVFNTEAHPMRIFPVLDKQH